MRIRYDCHLHSDFSGDCDTPAPDMILRAKELKLQGLCFTEHFDPDAPGDIDFTLDCSAYLQRLRQLQRQQPAEPEILIGMEFGIQPHLKELLPYLNQQYPFDFIIASLHYINGMDPYYPSYFEGRKEQDCYEEFFRIQLETLRAFPSDSWDTLGHMDYIVRYGPNQNRFYSYEAYADFIDPILRYLIEHGKCLEVNAGGFRHGLGEPNPCSGVLKRYRELGGELITIGSDAHELHHLCFDFDRLSALLDGLGFRFYTVFRQRKGQQIRL